MCYVFIVLHLQGSCRLEWIYPPTTVRKSICMYQRMQAYEQCQTAGGNMEGDEKFLVIQAMSRIFCYTAKYIFYSLYLLIIQAKWYCHHQIERYDIRPYIFCIFLLILQRFLCHKKDKLKNIQLVFVNTHSFNTYPCLSNMNSINILFAPSPTSKVKRE